MHDTYISGHLGITLNASCMPISGGRTEQLYIIAGFFCRVTGFTSDFLSFIVVEHIRFFHGALQLLKLVYTCKIIVKTEVALFQSAWYVIM